ncbi:type II secretion system minor pseudopilin GspI [Legionella dresdenensis]|uniref:Type II secretion system protein I n=1 Tax=Legionella dresdenensis TaxID=450200 RepID=A0ABV8CBQ0_9GAMM
MNKKHVSDRGFTLIEVLLALVIIAIALTALMKATTEDVALTQRLKEKTLSHWVAAQGVSMIQLGLLPMAANQEASQVTRIAGQRWYWRAKISTTALAHVDQITITVSKNETGPFIDPLIAYKFRHE